MQGVAAQQRERAAMVRSFGYASPGNPSTIGPPHGAPSAVHNEDYNAILKTGPLNRSLCDEPVIATYTPFSERKTAILPTFFSGSQMSMSATTETHGAVQLVANKPLFPCFPAPNVSPQEAGMECGREKIATGEDQELFV
jgi:hypothetical protein